MCITILFRRYPSLRVFLLSLSLSVSIFPTTTKPVARAHDIARIIFHINVFFSHSSPSSSSSSFPQYSSKSSSSRLLRRFRKNRIPLRRKNNKIKNHHTRPPQR